MCVSIYYIEMLIRLVSLSDLTASGEFYYSFRLRSAYDFTFKNIIELT